MADPRPDFPDFFGDSINVAGGTYGVALTFFASDPLGKDDAIPGEIVGRARISPEMAAALAAMLAEAVENVRKANEHDKPAETSKTRRQASA